MPKPTCFFFQCCLCWNGMKGQVAFSPSPGPGHLFELSALFFMTFLKVHLGKLSRAVTAHSKACSVPWHGPQFSLLLKDRLSLCSTWKHVSIKVSLPLVSPITLNTGPLLAYLLIQQQIYIDHLFGSDTVLHGSWWARHWNCPYILVGTCTYLQCVHYISICICIKYVIVHCYISKLCLANRVISFSETFYFVYCTSWENAEYRAGISISSMTTLKIKYKNKIQNRELLSEKNMPYLPLLYVGVGFWEYCWKKHFWRTRYSRKFIFMELHPWVSNHFP